MATTSNRPRTLALWSKPTPTYLVSGILIAQFQLVGRSSADRLIDLSETSLFFELRLWILATLSCWLLVAAAVHRPPTPRPQRDVLSVWRNSTLLFLTYMIFTSVWAPDTGLALAKSYDLLTLAWSCVLAATTIRLFGVQATIDGFWIGLFISAGILAIAGTFTALRSGGSLARLSVLGGGPNVFGRNMGLLTIVSLHFAFSTHRLLRIVGYFSAPLAGLLVLQSGSRGAMLALFVGVVVFVGIRGIERRVVYASLTIAGVAAIAFATRFGELAALIFRERFLVLLLAQRYFTHRDTLLVDGLSAGIQNPVGGLGLAGFMDLDSPGLYPHNFVVEAFSEGGIIGLALLSVPFFYYLSRLTQGMTVGHPVAAAGLGLLIVSSSFSGDLFDARGVFLVLLMTLSSQMSSSYHGTRV